MREEGEVAASQPVSAAVHRSPNELWRSYSIFNLWFSRTINRTPLGIKEFHNIYNGTENISAVVCSVPYVGKQDTVEGFVKCFVRLYIEHGTVSSVVRVSTYAVFSLSVLGTVLRFGVFSQSVQFKG